MTALRANILDAPTPGGRPKPCRLPGHEHLARLVPTGAGVWNYHCPEIRPISLAELCAVLAYVDVPWDDTSKELDGPWHRVRLPGSTEVSRWAEFLDHQAGLRTPRRVPIWLPADLPETAGLVGEAIRLHLGLRDESRWGTQPFTFAKRFCQARTGLTAARARAGLMELRRRWIVVPVSSGRGPRHYRLGLAHEVLGGDDEVVDRFIGQFDAVEVRGDVR